MLIMLIITHVPKLPKKYYFLKAIKNNNINFKQWYLMHLENFYIIAKQK